MSSQKWLFYRTACHKGAKKHKRVCKRACLPAPIVNNGGGGTDVAIEVSASATTIVNGAPDTDVTYYAQVDPPIPATPTFSTAAVITGPVTLTSLDVTIDGLVASNLGATGYVGVAVFAQRGGAPPIERITPYIVVAGAGAVPPTTAPNQWHLDLSPPIVLPASTNDIAVGITLHSGSAAPPSMVVFTSLRAIVRGTSP